MLRSTFIHLRGIGAKSEREYWKRGIWTWADLAREGPPQPSLFSDDDSGGLHTEIAKSEEALERGDLDYFAERLPKSEHYRIALSVPEKTVFVDIETTGLSLYYDHITLIGASVGAEFFCYLDKTAKAQIIDTLESAKCLVTFNGTLFDLKFIRKRFPDIRLPKAHVDLRFLAKSVGLSGGQKKIETEIEIDRPEELHDMAGEKAPLLWHEYRLGDREAGKTLVLYNHADVEGMKAIFDHTVEKILDRSPSLNFHNQVPKFLDQSAQLCWARSAKEQKPGSIYIPAFRGRRGPKITYRDLAAQPKCSELRVVGIDLTGSEERAVGWCLLDRNRAFTDRLYRDVEILVETQVARPDVVSIDSPLSMPTGRTRVTDDDPHRDEFGIMRICERMLKKRGVNVYPSLIPSMQRMTERGIFLAKQFRKLGIPVIECYPGAAQDIMDIPRKRAGLEYLQKGLGDFGIEGEFLRNGVSHDELDAITAAAVGLFFWSGKFEALGNLAEDYLIIPDLEKSPEGWLKRRVVGISGPIAAGKTTAARLLEKRGFLYTRYSLVLEELLKKRGKMPKIPKRRRAALQEFGDAINKDPGQRWLTKELVETLPSDGDLVIDGLRFPDDHATLVEIFGPAFLHIHVEASETTRLDRYQKLGHLVGDFRRATAHHVESQIRPLRELAHAQVRNELSLQGFHRGIGQAIVRHAIHGREPTCRSRS